MLVCYAGIHFFFGKDSHLSGLTNSICWYFSKNVGTFCGSPNLLAGNIKSLIPAG